MGILISCERTVQSAHVPAPPAWPAAKSYGTGRDPTPYEAQVEGWRDTGPNPRAHGDAVSMRECALTLTLHPPGILIRDEPGSDRVELALLINAPYDELSVHRSRLRSRQRRALPNSVRRQP